MASLRSQVLHWMRGGWEWVGLVVKDSMRMGELALTLNDYPTTVVLGDIYVSVGPLVTRTRHGFERRTPGSDEACP